MLLFLILLNHLGSGHFGKVRVAQLKNNSNKMYAVKSIYKEKNQANLELVK